MIRNRGRNRSRRGEPASATTPGVCQPQAAAICFLKSTCIRPFRLLGLLGGADFFGFVRLCGHSHCSEIRRRPLAIAVGDARRVDARMTMHAMTVDTMSWSADRQYGIPGTFILNIYFIYYVYYIVYLHNIRVTLISIWSRHGELAEVRVTAAPGRACANSIGFCYQFDTVGNGEYREGP